MMQQSEAEEPKQQAEQVYGRYEGEPAYNSYQPFDTADQPSLRTGTAAKVYGPVPDNKNVLRLIAFGIAVLALIAFAVICLIIAGGTGGWISFCTACLAVFIIAVVAIDKIK